MVVIPTNRPAIRRRLPAVVCESQAEKFVRIVAETAEIHDVAAMLGAQPFKEPADSGLAHPIP